MFYIMYKIYKQKRDLVKVFIYNGMNIIYVYI